METSVRVGAYRTTGTRRKNSRVSEEGVDAVRAEHCPSAES